MLKWHLFNSQYLSATVVELLLFLQRKIILHFIQNYGLRFAADLSYLLKIIFHSGFVFYRLQEDCTNYTCHLSVIVFVCFGGGGDCLGAVKTENNVLWNMECF